MREFPTRPSCDWAGAGTWCVTFTRGVTPDEVLARYGAVPHHARVMPKREADNLGADSYRTGTAKSVLRVGALGDWSFCHETWGVLGAMPGPLSALSRDTETFTVDLGGDGMNTFGHWRGGRCTEVFEPGEPATRPLPPHPWWDAVQEQREAAGSGEPGLVPAVRVIGDYIGAILDDDTVDGPLSTLLLGEDHPVRPPSPGGRGRGAVVPLTNGTGSAGPRSAPPA
ncbi:DUF6461 domain-containing protein [Streptomyces sp. NPDC001315]|uniref:DUF6461 domain-containing protein n=1 Tax=Streptomyces sp. NPDC001315 TaxID=3364562 RepID=UPI0036CDB397